MGFGSAPAGSGPAGLDAPGSTEARIASRPAALAFDGLKLDFVLDTKGRFVELHPIDAKFFNRMRVAVGSIRSAQSVGQGVSNLNWIDPTTIESFVKDQVNLAAADMIAAGEITLHGINLDLSVRGRVAFQPVYTNRITGSRKPLSLPTS